MKNINKKIKGREIYTFSDIKRALEINSDTAKVVLRLSKINIYQLNGTKFVYKEEFEEFINKYL